MGSSELGLWWALIQKKPHSTEQFSRPLSRLSITKDLETQRNICQVFHLWDFHTIKLLRWSGV